MVYSVFVVEGLETILVRVCLLAAKIFVCFFVLKRFVPCVGARKISLLHSQNSCVMCPCSTPQKATNAFKWPWISLWKGCIHPTIAAWLEEINVINNYGIV